MILQGSSPIYPIFAAVMIALSILLIPRKYYQYIFPNIFAGTLIVFVILYLASSVINAWKYTYAEPFAFAGVPIFILLAWGGAFAIFLWGLPANLPVWTHYIYIAMFAIVGIMLDDLFHDLGLRPYASWYSAWMWFFPMFLTFWINYTLYKKLKKLEK